MKIFKEGNLELLKQIRRFKCEKCGCIFEADGTEYETDSQHHHIYYTCDCPCCNKKVYSGEFYQ